MNAAQRQKGRKMKTQITNSGKLTINIYGGVRFGNEYLAKVSVSDIELAKSALRGIVLTRGGFDAKQARRDQISVRLAANGIVTI